MHETESKHTDQQNRNRIPDFAKNNWFDDDWWVEPDGKHPHDDVTWFDEDWWQDHQEEYDYQLGQEKAEEVIRHGHYYQDNDLPQDWWEKKDRESGSMPQALRGLNERYEQEPPERAENNIYVDWWEDHGAGYGYQYGHSNLANQYYTADDWWD